MKKLSIFLLILGAGNTALFGIAANKDSASYHLNLAKEAEDQRRFSVAWQHYEKASQFDNSNPAIYTAIASVCGKMNKMAPALKATERACELQPGNAALEQQLFDLYFQYGQWDKVILHGNKIAAGHNAPQGLHYKLGKAYNAQQDYGKATDHLKKAIKEDPSNAEANYLVGRMLLNMENYAAAIPYYTRSLELDATKPMRTYEFAMLLSTNMEFAKAVKYFEQALAQGYTGGDDFYLNMAYAYADAKMVDEGVVLFERLIAKRPQDIGLIDGLASTYYSAGKFSKAVTTWDRILDFDQNNARALYHIGLAYIKMGKETEGKQLCDKAIEIEPSLAVLKQKMSM